MTLYRPIVCHDRARPEAALPLAGGPHWFAFAEELTPGAAPRMRHAHELPDTEARRLTAPRGTLDGALAAEGPTLMGILNVTPDSFSDGGAHDAPEAALAHARAMARQARIIDVGGESTRPGAAEVPVETEIARVVPVIAALREAVPDVVISIDTRKTAVARAAVEAGARLVNDVSGFTFDPDLAPYCAEAGVAVCAMHSQGRPETMQQDPRYDDVLHEIYDHLAVRIEALLDAGVAFERISVDPGIGFGKKPAHNFAILRGLSVFHGLGCPVLLGASRKSSIAKAAGGSGAERTFGSVAVAQEAARQGIQILRVHDVPETAAALALAQAIFEGDSYES